MKLFKSKILVLMLITSITTFAQNELIYSKIFDTNSSTTAIFNLENTAVAIEESIDDKIHFDYKIEFKNYSKKEIKSFLDNIKVEATMFENNITLDAKSATKVSQTSYAFDTPFGLTLESDFFKTDSMTQKSMRKSKDSIIKLINDESLSKVILKSVKFLDNDNNEKPIDFDKVKMYKSQFVIKLPNSVSLKINAKESQITFRNDMTNELSIDLNKGLFKAKKLINNYNKIKIVKASFKSEKIVGGNYDFINVSNGLIGSIKNIKINSELSKLEIGEIEKNITITDFNSEYWFYNWSTDFGRFNLYSEYSKIHYFYPESDYSLKVVGNNTVNYLGETKITMQPTKNGKKFKMMERKPRKEGVFAGAINFDIVHGVIYSYDDPIILINKDN
ncbi:hypothetical protein MWU58_12855 [Flavobacteriaceae bacterium S0825]|uniref:hypothetical protein n=1 Tax=Gaetbulibacter sp. S0825 TaxID=2720084 RepID=UPI00143135B7|nr:hypothetical protein [Gaetbulibacter sp. S0825]MCK0110190.1 hypothetical protein [Flavobacteriaceae bacterium S0825]NIX65819.1 hypothetical protein [Gaetbulibacter sp. S0825]